MICLEWTLRAKSLSKTNTCQNSGKVFSPRSTSSGNLVRPSDMSVNSISTFRLLEHIFLSIHIRQVIYGYRWPLYFNMQGFFQKRRPCNYMYIENNPGIYERKKVRFSNFLFLVDSVVKILFFLPFFWSLACFLHFFLESYISSCSKRVSFFLKPFI